MIEHVFPNEVVSYNINNKWIYSIFKNASSSLRDSSAQKPIILQQHKKLQDIYVFIREPKQRFNSGVSTFLEYAQRDVGIDQSTLLTLIATYNILNRHYAPQMFWVLNLFRYINDSCIVHFNEIEKLFEILDKKTIPTKSKQHIDIVDQYSELDQILYNDLIGSNLTKAEVIRYIKNNHWHLYNKCFGTMKEICSVLD